MVLNYSTLLLKVLECYFITDADMWWMLLFTLTCFDAETCLKVLLRKTEVKVNNNIHQIFVSVMKENV